MMCTRDEHLMWCKARALQILESGDVLGAFASMTLGLKQREGGALYDEIDMAYAYKDAVLFRRTAPQMRNWIEGFN